MSINWPRVLGVGAAAGLMLFAIMWAAGVFRSDGTQNAYCVDGNGQVVAQQQCANPNPGVYLIITSRTYRSGQTVPASIPRIPADDPEARSNAGLPGTGEVPEHVQQPAQQAPVDNPAPAAPHENVPAPDVPPPVEDHPVIVEHPVIVVK